MTDVSRKRDRDFAVIVTAGLDAVWIVEGTGTANVRPAGKIQWHVAPSINIDEALRASEEKQRNTIRNFILDLRGEALVVEVSGLRGFSRRSAQLMGWTPPSFWR